MVSRIVDSKWGPIRNSGNGLMKVNWDDRRENLLRAGSVDHHSRMSGFYMPDYESSKTCYTTNLNIESCRFLPVDGATSTKAVNFVANAGRTGAGLQDVPIRRKRRDQDLEFQYRGATSGGHNCLRNPGTIAEDTGRETWTTVTQNSRTDELHRHRRDLHRAS